MASALHVDEATARRYAARLEGQGLVERPSKAGAILTAAGRSQPAAMDVLRERLMPAQRFAVESQEVEQALLGTATNNADFARLQQQAAEARAATRRADTAARRAEAEGWLVQERTQQKLQLIEGQTTHRAEVERTRHQREMAKVESMYGEAGDGGIEVECPDWCPRWAFHLAFHALDYLVMAGVLAMVAICVVGALYPDLVERLLARERPRRVPMLARPRPDTTVVEPAVPAALRPAVQVQQPRPVPPVRTLRFGRGLR